MYKEKEWVLGCPAPNCGMLAEGFYNAGAMLADDRNGMLPEDSKLQVLYHVTEEDFDNYVAYLKTLGIMGCLEHHLGNDKFFAFVQNKKYYHVSYLSKRGEIRVVEDIETTSITEFNDTKTGNQKPLFYQYGLYYDPENKETDKTTNCGMLYILKLSDDRLLMIDGGSILQCSNEMIEGLWRFLLRITNTPENGILRIAAWYFTHAHDDHTDGCTKLLNRYHDKIMLERVMFHFPYFGNIGGYSDSVFYMKSAIKNYYPQVKALKLHTGQKIQLSDLEIEVLYTQEDAVLREDLKKNHLKDFNSTSSILKLKIDGKVLIMLGDTTLETEQILKKYSVPDLWKADMVQVAHHCFNHLDVLYEWICAPIAVLPNSSFAAHTFENLTKLEGVQKWVKNDQLYYEGQGTDGFAAAENGFQHIETLPVIGGIYDGSGFE